MNQVFGRLLLLVGILAVALAGGCQSLPEVRPDGQWTAMDLYKDRYIFVKGSVNGRPTEMLLDTGASITVVDTALVEQLGLAASGTHTASGIGGVVPAQRVTGLELHLGGTRVRNLNALVIDLSFIRRMLGRALPIIVGVDVLNRVVVDLDYPRSRVAFRSTADYQYRGGGSTLPLRRMPGSAKWKVQMTLGDRATGWFQIDTGSGDSLDITERFRDQYDILAASDQTSEWLTAGLGGFAREWTFSSKSLRLGRYVLEDVPMSVQEAKGLFANRDFDGNLGAKILGRFRVICDFSRRRIHLEPGPDWRRPFYRDCLGIYSEPLERGLEVKLVAPGSPAAAAGVRKGVVICAIDEVEGTAWQLRGALLRAHRSPRRRTRLRDVDGREYQITLRRYF